MSFLSHLDHLIDRIPEGIQRTEDTIAGSYILSLLSMFPGVPTSFWLQEFWTRIVRLTLFPFPTPLNLKNRET